jgi:hypothetical protein
LGGSPRGSRRAGFRIGSLYALPGSTDPDQHVSPMPAPAAVSQDASASCWLDEMKWDDVSDADVIGVIGKNLMLLLAFVIPLCVLLIYVVVEVVK